MKSNYLFPNRYKKIGWILFIPGLIFGLVWVFKNPEIDIIKTKVIALNSGASPGQNGWFKIIEENITNEIIGLMIILGGIMVAFSKEKSEDEFISKIRLESLVWATYVNFVILGLAMLFVYGLDFIVVETINMFTILIFFIIRFNWVLSKSKKAIENEE